MSQATRPSDRHIIWSNQNLDVDDWREDYKEFLEANELDDDPNDEQALYEWMEETNYDYLSDERVNLNIQLSQPIIVIGGIGDGTASDGLQGHPIRQHPRLPVCRHRLYRMVCR